MKMKTILFAFIFFKSFILSGQTWTQINSPTTSRIDACFFLNENTGWIITNNSIHKTNDGGTTWLNQSFPVAPNQNIRLFNSIHFINENVGIIACGNYLYSGHNPNLVSTILWTNDGGINWVYKDLGSYNDYDLSAVLATPLIAYSIGQYGQSKKTIDGGITWTPCSFSSIGYSGINLFALNENTVFFAGLQNLSLTAAIGKMNNSNWLINDLFGSIAMQRIFFIDNNLGWVVGNSGVIKISNNGGNNWIDGNSGVTSTILGVSFKDSLNGWASTENGKILKSIDGGLNWEIEYDGVASINDITFNNLNNYGYAVGDNGKILKYNSNLQTNIFDNESFSIYPNPTNNQININSKSKILEIEIYNSMGQNVRNIKNCDTKTVTFEKENLSNGIYYLKITSENKIISTKKLIITN
jgi:photosystem II stability/assembly factor-like uncharacterized protein